MTYLTVVPFELIDLLVPANNEDFDLAVSGRNV